VKLERMKELFGRDDLIPLWVADMDFRSPPAIIRALQERVSHGIFGYTVPSEGYTRSIVNWLIRHHQWEVSPDHINFIPGVVKGIAFALDAFTKRGDRVIIQPPVYHPFRIVTQSMGREVVTNPLVPEGGRYRMNLDGLREIALSRRCKMLILCNPHNPGGTVWRPEELKELATICAENGILVVSDEIHGDMALPGHQHTPFATVSAEAEVNSLTFMAPSKTFNIAGIVSSFAVIPGKEVRERFLAYLEPRELQQGTLFAFTATRAAYEECDDWLRQMLDYVQGNVRFVDGYLREHIPVIEAMIPEASFLVWLDCRRLGLSQPELVRFFVDKAGLALNDGAIFGKEGEGFMRLNVGTSRFVLRKALNQLKNALLSLPTNWYTSEPIGW
jgi:cystathionine beta-lyase